MEQTLFEKFDKIVCPINIAKPPTVLENLSGLIICFLRIKSSKVIYDFSAKNITLWGCFFVLCRANRLGPRSFRLRNEQTLRADSSLNRALGAKSLQAPATRTKKTDSFGSVFFFYAGGDLNRKRKAFSGSRRLGNTVETRTQHSFASFLLISFGRFTKNSYQLFFPRLPATRTKRKSISFSLCILSGEIEVTKYRQRTCFLCRFVV